MAALGAAEGLDAERVFGFADRDAGPERRLGRAGDPDGGGYVAVAAVGEKSFLQRPAAFAALLVLHR